MKIVRRALARSILKLSYLLAAFSKPRYIESDKAPLLKAFSLIQNRFLAYLVRKVSFTDLDVRAAWLGPGLPKISGRLHKFQNFANWATEHLMMYMAFLPWLKSLPKTAKIADIGCGVGYPTVCLAKMFPTYQFTGVDYDKEAIWIARKFNSLANVKYLSKSIFDYDGSSKFDCIMALEILEHIKPSDHDRFIKKCLKLLKKNGLLIISTPNALDEEDAGYSHIGLLNRKRAKEFYKKYKKQLSECYFVNNKKLLTCKPERFVVRRPFSDFEKVPDLSHFHFVLEKR